MFLQSMKQTAVGICFYATIASAYCEEVTGLEFASQLDCSKGMRQCGAILKYADVAGSKLGIVVTKDESGSIAVLSSEGSLYPISINFSEIGHSAIRLTWDGDYNPRQLSSSGLNCLDLTQISKISIPVSVDGLGLPLDEGSNAATKLEASLLLYDGNDPTGQRYSVASVALPEAGSALEFQRERFGRQGMRGAADFSCVGALSLILRSENLRAIGLKLGIPSGGDVSFPSQGAAEVPRQVVPATPRIVGNDKDQPPLHERSAAGDDDDRGRQQTFEYPPSSGTLPIDEIPPPAKEWGNTDEDMPVYGEAVAVY